MLERMRFEIFRYNSDNGNTDHKELFQKDFDNKQECINYVLKRYRTKYNEIYDDRDPVVIYLGGSKNISRYVEIESIDSLIENTVLKRWKYNA